MPMWLAVLLTVIVVGWLPFGLLNALAASVADKQVRSALDLGLPPRSWHQKYLVCEANWKSTMVGTILAGWIGIFDFLSRCVVCLVLPPAPVDHRPPPIA